MREFTPAKGIKKPEVFKTNEQTFNDYVNHFELEDHWFEGDKRILDVGSGAAQFARYVKGKFGNTSVVSLERELPQTFQMNFRDKKEFIDVKIVIGDSRKMEFPDESFDLVVSHCAVPTMAFSRKDPGLIVKSIQEILRVTKPNGEIRLYPIRLEDADLFDSALAAHNNWDFSPLIYEKKEKYRRWNEKKGREDVFYLYKIKRETENER